MPIYCCNQHAWGSRHMQMADLELKGRNTQPHIAPQIPTPPIFWAARRAKMEPKTYQATATNPRKVELPNGSAGNLPVHGPTVRKAAATHLLLENAAPRGRAMAHRPPTGAPLRPHRRPPRACVSSQQQHPSGTPTRQGYGTPAHPSAHIGGLPGHAATPLRRPPLGRAMAHPSGASSAHIGGLPGHAAVINCGTLPVHPLRYTPSGAPPPPAGLWPPSGAPSAGLLRTPSAGL